MRFIPVMVNKKEVGTVWKEGPLNWHCEVNRTGMSWGLISTKRQAVALVKEEA